jgi:dCMP deaminase
MPTECPMQGNTFRYKIIDVDGAEKVIEEVIPSSGKDLTDRNFLVAAYMMAGASPDPSTQNGSILVDEDGIIIGKGCNTFPHWRNEKPERLVSPLKYSFVEHAERSAIYYAAKSGGYCRNATLYCPWFACTDCARAIICAGIKRVVGHQRMMDKTPERWKESISNAMAMLEEAGITMVLIQGDLPEAPRIRFNGEEWQP